MEKVIIRSDRAGVFYGELISKEIAGDKLMVEMKNTKRIFSWVQSATLSQLAVDGSKEPNECKITMPVDKITIMGVVEIIPMTQVAIDNLDSVPIWKI